MTRSFVALGIAGATTVASPALADPVVWTISTDRPADCSAAVADARGELALTCRAVGTCRLADEGETADYDASLDCDGHSGPWRLVARSKSGQSLFEKQLIGERDDRLRTFALAIAEDPAPERGLAADATRDTLGTARPVSPSPASTQSEWSASAAGSYSAPGIAGGRAALTHRVWDIVFAGASLAADTRVTAPGSFDLTPDELTLGRLSAVFGLGAPYAKTWFGLYAEVGVGFGRSSERAGSATSGRTGETLLLPVFGLMPVLSIPWSIRPYAAPWGLVGRQAGALRFGGELGLAIDL